MTYLAIISGHCTFTRSGAPEGIVFRAMFACSSFKISKEILISSLSTHIQHLPTILANSSSPTQLNTAPTATSLPVFANLLNNSWGHVELECEPLPKTHEPTIYSKHAASEGWWSNRGFSCGAKVPHWGCHWNHPVYLEGLAAKQASTTSEMPPKASPIVCCFVRSAPGDLASNSIIFIALAWRASPKSLSQGFDQAPQSWDEEFDESPIDWTEGHWTM